MKGLQVTSPLPPYPTEPVAPPQGKKGTSALSALLEMEQNQKWVSYKTAGWHAVCVIPIYLSFICIHSFSLRTLDEQQQQAKPSASVCEASSFATAPTYVDSPRKVSMCSVCVFQYKLICFRQLLRTHLKVLLSVINTWIKYFFFFFAALVRGLCSCFMLSISIPLFHLVLLSFGCLILGCVLPVCWQDAAFILDFIRSPRSSYIYHSQVSNEVPGHHWSCVFWCVRVHMCCSS